MSCKACGGSGKKKLACRYCGGAGAITSSGKSAGFFSIFSGDKHTCKKCAGTGTFEVICRNCNGTGTRRGAQKIGYFEMERRRKALNAEYMKAKTPEKRQQVNSRLHEVFSAWIYGE